MARSKNGVGFAPFLMILALAGVIYYIVRREKDAGFTQAVAWFGQQLEGFDTRASTAIKCPNNWKFFNDSRGASFCCGATVNPYGATCSDPAKMCAFEPNVADPRGGARPAVPICKA
jgi:hypothetical protein